jgi:hypothetical protein
MAFSNASVTLIHGMSRPLGAAFHIPRAPRWSSNLPSVQTPRRGYRATAARLPCHRRAATAWLLLDLSSDRTVGTPLNEWRPPLNGDACVLPTDGMGWDGMGWDACVLPTDGM